MFCVRLARMATAVGVAPFSVRPARNADGTPLRPWDGCFTSKISIENEIWNHGPIQTPFWKAEIMPNLID